MAHLRTCMPAVFTVLVKHFFWCLRLPGRMSVVAVPPRSLGLLCILSPQALWPYGLGLCVPCVRIDCLYMQTPRYNPCSSQNTCVAQYVTWQCTAQVSTAAAAANWLASHLQLLTALPCICAIEAVSHVNAQKSQESATCRFLLQTQQQTTMSGRPVTRSNATVLTTSSREARHRCMSRDVVVFCNIDAQVTCA
jgi:hypothetical protein